MSIVSNGPRVRRFKSGLVFNVGGVPFRIVHGVKGPDDLRLDWKITTPSGRQWHPLPMAVAFLMVAFFYENEEVLFPYPAAGGEKFMRALRRAVRDGWESASHDLDRERSEKQRRLEEGEAS